MRFFIPNLGPFEPYDTDVTDKRGLIEHISAAEGEHTQFLQRGYMYTMLHSLCIWCYTYR